jgi:surface antigen
MSFTARTEAPTAANKYWIHTSCGGRNACIKITGSSCIPNCVGYAWGRFYEISGEKPKLSRGNAEMWYGYNDGYERGQTPREGAVICWRKGKVGASDGAGHVAIVEKVYDDGSILISESGYNSFRFRTQRLRKPYAIGGTYVFQGFIYNPAVKGTAEAVTKTKASDKVQFIKSLQEIFGVKVNGIATKNLLAATVTISAKVNSKHKAVKPLQIYLNHLGYDCGEADGIAGVKFTKAVTKYQLEHTGTADGEITAKGKTWRKLLGLK